MLTVLNLTPTHSGVVAHRAAIHKVDTLPIITKHIVLQAQAVQEPTSMDIEVQMEDLVYLLLLVFIKREIDAI